MNNTKTLETDRLILRKFNNNDYVKMYENWASDENVMKYVSFGKVMEKAGMKKDGILRERRINKIVKGYDDLVIYSLTKEDLK